MNALLHKPKENRSTQADISSQKGKSNNNTLFTDNRPEAAAQRKLQQAADNSAQVKQAKTLQKIADNHTSPTIQLMLSRVGTALRSSAGAATAARTMPPTTARLLRLTRPLASSAPTPGDSQQGPLEGSFARQFLGGTGVAAAFTMGVPTNDMNVPREGTEYPPGRAELNEVLVPFLSGEYSERVKNMAKMIKGQNNAQIRLGQPVTLELVQAFKEQLELFVRLDDDSIYEHLPESEKLRKMAESHRILAEVFRNAKAAHPDSGLGSGAWLHTIGALLDSAKAKIQRLRES